MRDEALGVSVSVSVGWRPRPRERKGEDSHPLRFLHPLDTLPSTHFAQRQVPPGQFWLWSPGACPIWVHPIWGSSILPTPSHSHYSVLACNIARPFNTLLLPSAFVSFLLSSLSASCQLTPLFLLIVSLPLPQPGHPTSRSNTATAPLRNYQTLPQTPTHTLLSPINWFRVYCVRQSGSGYQGRRFQTASHWRLSHSGWQLPTACKCPQP